MAVMVGVAVVVALGLAAVSVLADVVSDALGVATATATVTVTAEPRRPGCANCHPLECRDCALMARPSCALMVLLRREYLPFAVAGKDCVAVVD